jgi:transposase
VTKAYRPYSPKQAFLLPPSPTEWLPEDHLARFVMDVAGQLDLSAIHARYQKMDPRGTQPYHPLMMTSLLVYGYCVGVASSRRIETKTYEDVAFRVIAGGQHPDHVRISEFRRVNLDALADLFSQVLALATKAGLVKLGKVALDGTKVKANASKHKAMSYERMEKDAERLRQKVQELLSAAEAADSHEDAEYGPGRRGDELPEDLRHAEGRLARIKQLKAELEAEARQQDAEAKARKDDDKGPPPPPTETPLPRHRIPRTKDGAIDPKAQRNFTDAESRIMKASEGYVQAYNCQAVVDQKHQIIVAQAVTNQPPDVEHLVPMLVQTVANCGAKPDQFLADAGYFSEANICEVMKWGIEPFIPPYRQRRADEPKPVLGRPPANLSFKDSMVRKLATKAGRAVYAFRKTIVEPVFGQIKEARGFRRFLLRGLRKVRGEWALIGLTHNLLKIHRANLRVA